MKYYFDLGTFDKNVTAFKDAVTKLNSKYGYPNTMGTQTSSDMYIHPDGVKVAMDLQVKEDSTFITGGTAVETLDSSWDEAKVDTKTSRDGTEKKEEPK